MEIINKILDDSILSESEITEFLDNYIDFLELNIEENIRTLFLKNKPIFSFDGESLYARDDRFSTLSKDELYSFMLKTELMYPNQFKCQYDFKNKKMLYGLDINIVQIYGNFQRDLAEVMAYKIEGNNYNLEIIEEYNVFDTSLLEEKRKEKTLMVGALLGTLMSFSVMAEDQISLKDLSPGDYLPEVKTGETYSGMDRDIPLGEIDLGRLNQIEYKRNIIDKAYESFKKNTEKYGSLDKEDFEQFEKIGLKTLDDLVKESKTYKNLDKDLNRKLKEDAGENAVGAKTKTSNKQRQYLDIDSSVKTLKGRANINIRALDLVEAKASANAFSSNKIKASVETTERDVFDSKVKGALSYEKGSLTQGAYIDIGDNINIYGERIKKFNSYESKEVRTGVGFKWNF